VWRAHLEQNINTHFDFAGIAVGQTLQTWSSLNSLVVGRALTLADSEFQKVPAMCSSVR